MSRRALCLLHIYDLYQGGKDHMKKNVKYLGMTAAALLAVAPVISSGVANADVTANGSVPATAASATANVINVASTATAQPEGTKASSLTNQSAVENALQLNGSNAKIAGFGGAAIVPKSPVSAVEGVNGNDALQSGHYQLVTTVSIGNLTPNTTYTIKQGNKYVNIKANQNGIIDNVKITLELDVYNSNSIGQPYFVNAFDGQTVQPGGYVNKKANWSDTVSGVLANAEKVVTARYNDVNGAYQPATITTTVDDIKSQLSNQGISTFGNSLSTGANSFYVTLTAVNPNNNKTATVKVQFVRGQSTENYPTIQYNFGGKIGWDAVQEGTTSLNKVPTVRFDVNSAAAHAFRAGDNFRAFNTVPGSGESTLQVVKNTVNPDQIGVYQVTLRATNPNGYSTDLTYNVMIQPVGSASATATVHFAKGYSVNLWNVLSNNSVAFTGKHIPSGAVVTPHETKTVDGVSYTRITGSGIDGSAWIQTQYLSDAWRDGQSSNTNTSTSSSKEEAFNGVIVVRYNGKGSVALVDGEGHYGTGNYAKKNMAYKAFAKKTINGKTYYRLGTDKQWIPDQYVEVR